MNQPNKQDRKHGFAIAWRAFLAMYVGMGLSFIVLGLSYYDQPTTAFLLESFFVWPKEFQSIAGAMVLAELMAVAGFIGYLKTQLAWHQRMQAGNVASWEPGMDARQAHAAAEEPAGAGMGGFYAKE